MAKASQTLAARVKARRTERGLSMADVVAVAAKGKHRLGKATISSIEAGKLNPSLDVLRAVAAGLDCQVSDLVDGQTHAVRMVAAGHLRPSPFNPRSIKASSDGLDGSIQDVGVLLPLIARPLPAEDGTHPGGAQFEIIAGERRWRSAMAVHGPKHLLPVRICEADDRTALRLALTENIQRADMHPLDVAEAFKRLADHGDSTDQIAGAFGKGKRVVQEYISVARHCTNGAKNALTSGFISISHAIALAGERDEKRQNELVTRVARERLSEDDVRAAIAGTKAVTRAAAPPATATSQADIEDVPGVKKWPKPNKSGVYSEEEPHLRTYTFSHARGTIELRLLQIAADKWIEARSAEHPGSGRGGPLTADVTYSTLTFALRVSCTDACIDLANGYAGGAQSWSKAARNGWAEMMARFAIWAESILRAQGGLSAPELKHFRTLLDDRINKAIDKGNKAVEAKVRAADDDLVVMPRGAKPPQREQPHDDEGPDVLFDAGTRFVVIHGGVAQIVESFNALASYVLDAGGNVGKRTPGVRPGLRDPRDWLAGRDGHPFHWQDTSGAVFPTIEVYELWEPAR